MSIRKGTTIIAGNSSPLDWTGTLQEYNIALENGTIKENMVCYITDDTLYTDDIRPEIDRLDSIKASVNLNNLTPEGERHFLNKSQITNCITEIPQRIKLELNNGVLTLKAGSEVIIPNGFEADGVTPKFDYVTVESDLTSGSYGYNVDCLLFYNNNVFYALYNTQCFSGSNAPNVDSNSSATFCWYDTVNNVIKESRNGGSTWTVVQNISLPFGLATSTTTNWVSLNQVFNGVGYIGSIIWVDKGVKGLIPNGRNEDGTLKNVEYTIDVLQLRDNSDWDAVSSAVQGFVIHLKVPNYPVNTILFQPFSRFYSEFVTPSAINAFNYAYIESENQWYYWTGQLETEGKWVKSQVMPLANMQTKGGYFQPKQPFRAVDYSDKPEISGWCMPSSKYINLTLGASVSTYTAPANGWFVLAKECSNGQYIYMGAGGVPTQVWGAGAGYIQSYLPVLKGETVNIGYTASGATAFFRFHYAEGEM